MNALSINGTSNNLESSGNSLCRILYQMPRSIKILIFLGVGSGAASAGVALGYDDPNAHKIAGGIAGGSALFLIISFIMFMQYLSKRSTQVISSDSSVTSFTPVNVKRLLQLNKHPDEYDPYTDRPKTPHPDYEITPNLNRSAILASVRAIQQEDNSIQSEIERNREAERQAEIAKRQAAEAKEKQRQELNDRGAFIGVTKHHRAGKPSSQAPRRRNSSPDKAPDNPPASLPLSIRSISDSGLPAPNRDDHSNNAPG